jgi:hypothetical protein
VSERPVEVVDVVWGEPAEDAALRHLDLLRLLFQDRPGTGVAQSSQPSMATDERAAECSGATGKDAA